MVPVRVLKPSHVPLRRGDDHARFLSVHCSGVECHYCVKSTNINLDNVFFSDHIWFGSDAEQGRSVKCNFPVSLSF